MRIYLDTNLWNTLCDQDVDADHLGTLLAAKNATLVISHQAVYELARTFLTSRDTAVERGRRLFACLSKFLQLKIPCTKEIANLLEAEMRSLQTPVSVVDPFISAANYDELRKEVEKLAAGTFDEQMSKFVAVRSALSSVNRAGPAQQLDLRTDMKQRLTSVPLTNLEEWLQVETLAHLGVLLLSEKITSIFPEAPPGEAVEWAKDLVASPGCRLAKGLVRADLYYNWRRAHRGSNPKDLYDDMYHVLNALYCDVYATKEPKQEEYARFLLTADTRVAIYKCEVPLKTWLETVG
jgi:hypothetical protein